MMFILQGKFSVACFVHCLVLLSNNHQSSGMFYPNITLPQIGPNISTEPQSHPTTIFPDLEKNFYKIVKLLLEVSLTFSMIAFIVLFKKHLLLNKIEKISFSKNRTLGEF